MTILLPPSSVLSPSDSTGGVGNVNESPSTTDFGDAPTAQLIRTRARLRALGWKAHRWPAAATGAEESESVSNTSPPASQRLAQTPGELVVGLKKSVGMIQEIEDGLVTVELSPFDHEGPTLVADFDLSLLAPDEETVQPGDVIYLINRVVKADRGYSTATTQIRLRRLGQWSKNELDNIRDAARQEAEDFSRYVD